MIVILFSILGLASPFSTSNLGTVAFSSRLSIRSRNFNHELSAIPKKEAKGNPFQVQASAFRRYNEVLESENEILTDITGLEADLLRQKAEFEATLRNDTIIGTLDRFEFEASMRNDTYIGTLERFESAIQQTHIPVPKSALDAGKLQFLSTVWQARLLLLASACLYGTNFTFVKILNENVPVQIGTSLRFTLAAIATLPWLFKTGEQDMKNVDALSSQVDSSALVDASFNPAILGGLEVGLWNAIGYLSQAIGLDTTPASTSAFICSLAVVVVPMLDFLAGKKILPRQLTGALLAVAGVAFLELDGLQGGVPGSSFALSTGEMYSLVQPVAFGIGFWRMEHFMRKHPNDAMKLTAAQLSVIAMASIASYLSTVGGVGELPDVSQLVAWLTTGKIIGAICWTGLITTALTVYMETLALKTLSAAETTMIFSTEPIFGGICASAVLGEQFGVGGYIGAAMVLGGCLFSNIDFGKNEDELIQE